MTFLLELANSFLNIGSHRVLKQTAQMLLIRNLFLLHFDRK
jgi:hypothetical protein